MQNNTWHTDNIIVIHIPAVTTGRYIPGIYTSPMRQRRAYVKMTTCASSDSQIQVMMRQLW